MREWDADRIAKAAGAKLVDRTRTSGRASGPARVVIDSREVLAGDLFVGLKGGRVDGGEYAKRALQAGAWGVLVTPEHAAVANAARAGTASTDDKHTATNDNSPPPSSPTPSSPTPSSPTPSSPTPSSPTPSSPTPSQGSTTVSDAVVMASEDPLASLQRLAQVWLKALKGDGAKVIAITGSTGKTSTKDILAALVAPHRKAVASPENQNTEIGMPLAILAAPAGTEVLVLEMAMRGKGQIAELTRIAEPDVGVIVNVGPVHLEQMGSVQAIAAAKAELIQGLRPGTTAVVPADEPLLRPYLRSDVRTVTFGSGGNLELVGRSEDGQVVIEDRTPAKDRTRAEDRTPIEDRTRAKDRTRAEDRTRVKDRTRAADRTPAEYRTPAETVRSDSDTVPAEPTTPRTSRAESSSAEPGGFAADPAAAGPIPSASVEPTQIVLEPKFEQEHNLKNLLAAVAAARAVGVTPAGEVRVRFSKMRGQRIELPEGIEVIEDCYNANPMSMRAAIDDLMRSAHARSPRKTSSLTREASQLTRKTSQLTREASPLTCTHARTRAIAVLGDMLELGAEQERYHREIGEYAAERGVDVLVAVGARATAMAQAFEGHGETHSVPDARAGAELLEAALEPGDTVLIKGSRGVELERVSEALIRDASPTTAQTDRDPTLAETDRDPTPPQADRDPTLADTDRDPTPPQADRDPTPAETDRDPTLAQTGGF